MLDRKTQVIWNVGVTVTVFLSKCNLKFTARSLACT